jgi:hypothetical protein
MNATQCGRSGQTDCIRARCIGSYIEVRITGAFLLLPPLERSHNVVLLAVFQQSIVSIFFKFTYVDLIRTRIPFFFEPNFDAHVQPLEAAIRIQQREKDEKMKADSEKRYKPVAYGQFLMAKVGNNFAQGKYRDT